MVILIIILKNKENSLLDQIFLKKIIIIILDFVWIISYKLDIAC